MSLDYAFVKCLELPSRLAEMKEDPAYQQAHYRALAEALFPSVEWQAGGTGIAHHAAASFELRPTDASLSMSARGDGDLLSHIVSAAMVALQHGVVTIDIQTSELLAPDLCEHKPEYAAWYRGVVYGQGG